MLELLRKRLSVVITLVTLMLSALFLARGTTSLVAGAVLPIETNAKPAARASGAAKPAPGSEVPDFATILKRNMFDPTTGPLWPPPPKDPVVDPAAEVADVDTLAPGQLPPACEGSARLVAAVYSERHPEWSFASMTDGSNAPLLYRQGSNFADKQVDSIFPKAVFLRANNGRLCSVGMFNELPAAGPNAPPTPTPPVAATAPRSPTGAAATQANGISNEELDQNIRQASDTKFSVQRGLVDKILENQAEIMRSARIVPHEQNGQVVGVKLYGIRRNSLLGKLGLQNGDLLQSINGYNMASPDSALEAYSRLRSASNLSVMVTRRGKPMTVEYTIE